MKEESVSTEEHCSEVHVFSMVLEHGFHESIAIPIAFARDIVPLPETISLKLAGKRAWTVSVREERGRLVLEDGWEEFVRENSLKLNDTVMFKYHTYGELFCLHVSLLNETEYEENKVQTESMVFGDDDGDCVAKTKWKKTLDEDDKPKPEPIEFADEEQQECQQLEFSGAAPRLIQGKSWEADPSSKQRKISKQQIRHRDKHAKKRQRQVSPVRNGHGTPTSKKSARDKGKKGHKKASKRNETTEPVPSQPEKPSQGETAKESDRSYYVGASIDHNLTYATYFHSQRRAVTEEEVKKAFESARAVVSYKPNFISVMQPSIVQRRFFLTIPQQLLKAYIPRRSKEAILRVPPNPKTWIAQVIHRKYSAGLNLGWADFVMDNNLEEGDACLFELCDVQECGRYLMHVSIHRVVEEITPLKKLQLPYCMRGKRTKE